MKVTTRSGSIYEIVGDLVRRVNFDAGKRGDGVWQLLVDMSPSIPKIGFPMVLVLGSLAKYGGDDIGTPLGMVSGETTRITTAVTEVTDTKEN